MLKSGLKIAVVMMLAWALHSMAFAAEVINLPPEELAQESVLPVFDKPVAVKNRNIVTEGRFDVDVFYGMALTEPIANVSKFGFGAYYNTSEDHAFGILFAKNATGLSDYAQQISDSTASGLDFNRAPKPEMTLMGDYNFKAFYGKMSITKSLVFNTLLFGSASLGAVKYEHKTYPAIALGLGQKFFFTKQWALRFDLRLYANQAPIPFLGGGVMQPGSPAPSAGDFSERLTYTTNLDIGLSYLF